MARAHEIVVQPLDPRLVADGRIGVRPRGGRLGRVLTALAVDEVEALGLVIVGSEVLVAEWPGGRDPAVVADLAEVAFAEPEEDRGVELRLAAHVVVLARVEWLPALVVPGLVRLVLVAHEHRVAVPVVGLAAQVVAALEQQDASCPTGRAGTRACRRLRPSR